jgi:hypothetical protein
MLLWPLPLLADVSEWIGLAVLVLSFLGWIVNAIKGNQPDGAPKPARPKPQRDLRAELEVFLEELQSGKPEKADVARPPAERSKPSPVMAPAVKKKSRPDKKPQSKPAPKTLVQPTVKPLAVGGGVREHVAAYMTPDRVGAHAQQHIGQHRIDEAVTRDLAGGTVAAVEPVAGSPRNLPHPLLQVLSSREGVRQAVLLQEILQKPRALRRSPESGA